MFNLQNKSHQRGELILTNQQIIKLVQSFQVQAKHTRFVKSGVYRVVSTDGKPYGLKRMSYSLSRLRWMDRVLKRVRLRGFSAISWRNPLQRGGKPLYVKSQRGGIPYILTPWIKGRPPSPSSPTDIEACAAALARFHLAGRQAALSGEGALNVLGKWPSMLRSREALLKRQISKAKRSGHNRPLDRLLQTHGDSLLQRSQEALSILNDSDYKAASRKASENHALCHGDSGPKNFVMTPNGPYIIDFETLRLDLRAYDLYRMIRLACKNKGWKFTTARAVLDGYHNVSKLVLSDIEFIKIWLLFPNKAYKMLSRFDQSGVQGKRNIERALQDVIADERQLIPFLQQLDSYAKKELIG
jgi:CotS family spore coat protein